jgi:hypothetical protein
VLGYTTPERVQQRAGRALTSAELEEVVKLIEAAESWITSRTGRVWPTGVAGATVTEYQTINSRKVYLRVRPVQAVTTVAIRPARVGAQEEILTAGDQYELLDAAKGILLLNIGCWRYRGGNILRVVYSPAAGTLDPRVALATTDLVLFWMQPILQGLPVGGNIQSYRVGDDLSVTFRDGSGTVRGVPDTIVAAVDSLRGMIFA